jgi:hypothetical protein
MRVTDEQLRSCSPQSELPPPPPLVHTHTHNHLATITYYMSVIQMLHRLPRDEGNQVIVWEAGPVLTVQPVMNKGRVGVIMELYKPVICVNNI